MLSGKLTLLSGETNGNRMSERFESWPLSAQGPAQQRPTAPALSPVLSGRLEQDLGETRRSIS